VPYPIINKNLTPGEKNVIMVSEADPGCLSRIPDPTFYHPGSELSPSRIPDPGSSSKNLSILTPQKRKKWFLSSKKYDPGCSSRIPDQDADFLPSWIPDPGVKKAPNPGSRIRIRNTDYGVPDHILWCYSVSQELGSEQRQPNLVPINRKILKMFYYWRD
jgi:hypothetical protein